MGKIHYLNIMSYKHALEIQDDKKFRFILNIRELPV